MLKDLFSNRLFIGALAFFVLMVVGGTLYLQHVEKQTAEDLAAHEERIKEFTSEQKPTTETPVGDTSQGGHVHNDGNWHEGPHETPATPVESPSVGTPAGDVSVPFAGSNVPFNDPYLRMVDGFTVTSRFAIMMAPPGVGPDWASMSVEELADAIATINRTHGIVLGELSPPDGYKYPFGGTTVLSNGDNVWLDDNGYPILCKRNSPYFEIHWTEDFRPPPDVYADFKSLHERYISLLIQGEVAASERDSVSAEKDAMEQMYRGRVPTGVFSGGMVPEGMTPHQYFRQFREVEIQLKRNAYESDGIAYLMDRYSDLKEFAK